MVYLFEEKQLIALFQNTGDEATVIKDTYQTDLSRFSDGKRASRLYNLLWKPLEKHLKGVKKIYYSPSGLLHSVAFAAIAPKPGEVLADKYDLEYVSCTRELVIGRQVLQGDPSLLRDAVIFGGISYPTDSFLLALHDPCRNCSRGERSVPKYLPGSLEEMKAISAMLSAHGVACDTFSAYRASEARLKMFGARTNLPSPDILHLSTHGYYLPDPKVAADSTLYDAPFKWADNPLFRSWLLMAGGTDAHLGRPNHLSSYDDGVLTAYEIASLNLSNTKLVVLSACQTGLGDLRNTEGVYGLQRAFKMAGAQHLLVTLWEVDDNATARFMQLFYGHWLDGLPIHDAFKKAQAEMKNIYPDPYFWAPFILI
jgi:CHAT domain-containing protein